MFTIDNEGDVYIYFNTSSQHQTHAKGHLHMNTGGLTGRGAGGGKDRSFRLKEERRFFFEHFPEAVLVTDEDGKVLACTLAACRLFGYTKDEMDGLDFYSLFAGEARERLPELLKEENVGGGMEKRLGFVKNGGEVFRADLRSRTAEVSGKKYRWAVLHETSAEDGEAPRGAGFIPGFAGLAPEIMDEPEMIFETDAQGVLTHANKTALDKTGYEPGEMKAGIRLSDILRPEGMDRTAAGFPFPSSCEGMDGIECSITRRDGTAFPVIASVSPVCAVGDIRGMRVVAIDITEHKNAERELVILEKFHALGELAGGVVHDFRNILTVIQGYTRILLRECRKKRHSYIINEINRAVHDGVELVKKIQDAVQAEPSRVSGPVDLNETIREVVEMLKPRWDAAQGDTDKDIAVRKELRPIPPVRAGASEMREMMSNFLLNAVDAIETAGTITFRTYSRDDYVCVEISDTGTGMSEEVRRRVFEPFFSTKQKRGIGLGMSIVYGIVKRLGGDIEIESREGEGTTFTIMLPAMPEERDVPPAAPETESAAPCSVLVVDDEENICAILEELLSLDGFRVMTAENGDEGVRLFREHDFRVVLTDLNMPGMSGSEFARRIKEECPDTTVIVFTGHVPETKFLAGMEGTADLVLRKPIDFQALLEFIRRVAQKGGADGGG